MTFGLRVFEASARREILSIGCFSASVAQVVQVGAAAIPGGVETPASAAKFDKSDEVLFKAQDEFLRRLKVWTEERYSSSSSSFPL